MPKPTTTATAKWQEKAGLATKSYKLKVEVANAFAAACTEHGQSQAAVLTTLMQQYTSGQLCICPCKVGTYLRKRIKASKHQR